MTEPSNPSTISLLTPPGVGAIACLSVAGPTAWGVIRKHFHPAGQAPLPDTPTIGRFWFGTFGQDGRPCDEVILSVKPEGFELHCHGGVRVVRWIVGIFLEHGFVERTSHKSETSPWDLLSRAPTARTASVLLDQCRGAFRRLLEQILANWPSSVGAVERLAELAPLGRHLVEPWRVVIAGPPNVGKSSLLNALAGYTRSIVAPVKGTTRDVVTAVLAFDGWPVELSDTAGLHESTDLLESAGIAKAEEQLRLADLVLWVKDATADTPEEPPREVPAGREIIVWNKCDLAAHPATGLAVSAQTREGVPELIAAIVSKLVPREPQPLEAVPYTSRLTNCMEQARRAVQTGNLDAARASLASCCAELETHSDSPPPV